MLCARTRIFATARRTFATAVEQPKVSPVPKPADKKYKVAVVGAGPGGLSGMIGFAEALGTHRWTVC